MKCTIDGCPGVYERRQVVHTVRHRGDVVVVDGVPAEVCDVCGDVLLAPDTILHIEQLLNARPNPSRTIPMYQYA